MITKIRILCAFSFCLLTLTATLKASSATVFDIDEKKFPQPRAHGPNCYNAVLVCLGIMDNLRYVDKGELNYYIENFFEKIPETKDPEPGDLTLMCRDFGHAAIYLGEDQFFHKLGYLRKYPYEVISKEVLFKKLDSLGMPAEKSIYFRKNTDNFSEITFSSALDTSLVTSAEDKIFAKILSALSKICYDPACTLKMFMRADILLRKFSKRFLHPKLQLALDSYLNWVGQQSCFAEADNPFSCCVIRSVDKDKKFMERIGALDLSDFLLSDRALEELLREILEADF